MDKPFYQTQIKKLLSNQEYYKKLEESPHKDIMKNYNKYLGKYEETLTKKSLNICQISKIKKATVMVNLKYINAVKSIGHVPLQTAIMWS